MLILNKSGHLLTEQIWSQTELLRGGDRKRILLQCELLRGVVMNKKQASKRESLARKFVTRKAANVNIVLLWNYNSILY